jgi:HTH-type transcriptional regulator / antitoxin HigA
MKALGMMTGTAPAYQKLLAETAPAVIHTEQENEAAIERLEQLTAKRRATAAERKLAELLAVLIEDFEEKHYQLKAATPAEVLQTLMEAHGLRQKDLAAELGTPSIVSEVLSGKRGLTVAHIQRLARRFHVSPEVFIPTREKQ